VRGVFLARNFASVEAFLRWLIVASCSVDFLLILLSPEKAIYAKN
jgi:hypothetical protein